MTQKLMLREQSVLDQGYVELIEHWGSDQRIIEAARMSTQRGFLGWDDRCPQCDHKLDNGVCPEHGTVTPVKGDRHLLAYLYKHQHTTPFEMAGFTIEVKAPIMVIREWHRHRTQSYNEMSARYRPLPDENYMPSLVRCLQVNETNRATNKQATGQNVRLVTDQDIAQWQTQLAKTYAMIQETYELGLRLGIAKELARLPVAVGRYSVMRASANLLNWMKFIKLRCDPAAQWEIRQYAEVIKELVKDRFPEVYAVAYETVT